MYTEVFAEARYLSPPGKSNPRRPQGPMGPAQRRFEGHAPRPPSQVFQLPAGKLNPIPPKQLAEGLRKYLDSIDIPVRECLPSFWMAESPSTATKSSERQGKRWPQGASGRGTVYGVMQQLRIFHTSLTVSTQSSITFRSTHIPVHPCCGAGETFEGRFCPGEPWDSCRRGKRQSLSA